MNHSRVKISSENTFLVFDLDDTLYQEIEYLKSGYRYILKTMLPDLPPDTLHLMVHRYYAGENVFEWINSTYAASFTGLSVPALIQAYREHVPDIALSEETQSFLALVRQHHIPVGLITDGRSSSQRNKLQALGLADYFQDVIISEEFGSPKPHPENYNYFTRKYPGKQFYYIGDNTAKDFIVPVQLGWKTVCIKDKGHNIHRQCFGSDHNPHHLISSFREINFL